VPPPTARHAPDGPARAGNADREPILPARTRVATTIAGVAAGALGLAAVGIATTVPADGASADEVRMKELRGTTARLRAQLRHERADRRAAMRTLRRQVLATPSVDHAIRLGAAAFGQSPDRLRRVAMCESNLTPTAANGPYQGLFQFGAPLWSKTPFAGFARSDPYAAAFAASWAFSRGMDANWPVCGRT
jgi:hypothetical protein